MGFLPYSLEIEKVIVKNIIKETERAFYRKIIDRFNEEGFTIKVKYMFPKKPTVSYYRVFCFINKNNASVVIDAKQDGSFIIYLMIVNQKIFEKIHEFTDNVLNQILNAKDCPTPESQDCKGKIYHFTFNGQKYIKCVSISSNFKFSDISKSDFDNIMDIINSEIEYKSGFR